MNVPVRPAPALHSKQTHRLKPEERHHIENGPNVSLSPAVYDNGMVPGLLLLSLHRGDDVDHTFPFRWDTDLRPAVEVEVPDHPRLLLLSEETQAGERT